jgi:hypothetical protein
MNTYRQHTTENLLSIARVTCPLAVAKELERRGYAYDARCGRYVKEPARNDWRQPCSDESLSY